MTETSEPQAPDGRESTESVQVGEATRAEQGTKGGQREEARPDLDARERAIATTRKPAGPPLQEPTRLADNRTSESSVEPTDPA